MPNRVTGTRCLLERGPDWSAGILPAKRPEHARLSLRPMFALRAQADKDVRAPAWLPTAGSEIHFGRPALTLRYVPSAMTL